ncbi:tripartite tricarboxylate transporter permease [Halegenticoccus soli]|uniref:tripartite tricarboxylate transporter permease n=1 Tax=Halegenticoccus soli TaxID=1985678 RepID=UPI000C6DC780|nr:tripartite tricarboxylate transporter permease [Halegenticoccus soli]
MVLEQLVEGGATIFSGMNLLVFVFAIVLGMLSGAIPGMNGTMTVVLLIPLTYSMDPVTGIMMLSVIYVGAVYAGSISAIMFKVPGAPEAIMTTLDGYKMNQQGRMGEAISTAVFSSAVGGIVGTIILILFSPTLAAWSMNLSDPEYFSVVVVGLALVSTIGVGNVTKAAMMMAMGLVIATIGLDPFTGQPRFTFGNRLLFNGIELIPVILGVFAISEVLKQIQTGGQMVTDEEVDSISTGSLLPPLHFFKRFRKILSFNSITGTLIGILPGAGATTGALFGYTFAQRIVPQDIRERFGTGVPEGVAGPETANNAAASGAFVPLFALGIPGSATTAVILAAFILHGITPGPSFIDANETLVYTVFAALLLANVAVLLANKPIVRVFTKVRHIPQELLLALIVMFCVVGGFATRNITFDLWIMLATGIIGYYLEQYDYPIAPLVIGLVLGPIAEPSLRRGLIKAQGELLTFVQRPISLMLLVIAVILFTVPLLQETAFGRKYLRFGGVDQ